MAQLWQHLAPDPVSVENKMTGWYLKRPLTSPKVGGLMPIAQLHQTVEICECDHQYYRRLTPYRSVYGLCLWCELIWGVVRLFKHIRHSNNLQTNISSFDNVVINSRGLLVKKD